MLITAIVTAKDSPVEEITRLPSGFASKRTQANENYSTGEPGGLAVSSRPKIGAGPYFFRISPRLVRINHR